MKMFKFYLILGYLILGFIYYLWIIIFSKPTSFRRQFFVEIFYLLTFIYWPFTLFTDFYFKIYDTEPVNKLAKFILSIKMLLDISVRPIGKQLKKFDKFIGF